MASIALAKKEEQLCEPALAEFQHAYAELISQKGQLREQEERVMQRLREVGRLMLQEWVDKQGLGQVAEGHVRNGTDKPLTHVRIRERKITTIFGAIQIRRMGYGRRYGTSVFPLEAQCAIPAGHYSYGLQERACREATMHSYDEAIDSAD